MELIDHVPNKSKIVTIGAEFQTFKVDSPEVVSQYYLKIIRKWESGKIHARPKESNKIRRTREY